MSSDVAFTPITLCHVAMLAELHRQSFPRDPWSQRALGDILHMPACKGFIATSQDSSPLGFILGQIIAGEGEIYTLCVRPDSRRHHIGNRLLAHFLNQGPITVNLEVAVGNAPAIRLYRKHGFQKLATRPHYYRNGEDALVMRYSKEAPISVR